MNRIKVAISTPVDDNLYSLLVTKFCIDQPEIELVGVFSLHVWSFKRLLFESKRLGPLLIKKIWLKFFPTITQEDSQESTKIETNLRRKYHLKESSLRKLCSLENIDYLKTNSPNDSKTVSFLSQRNPDLVLSIGSVILKDEFIEIPAIGVLNVHMGILPEYRGIGVTEWPILEAKENNEVLIKSMIQEKLLTVKAGQNVIRMLPPLILEMKHVEEAINKIDKM